MQKVSGGWSQCWLVYESESTQNDVAILSGYHQQYLLKGGQSARKEDKSVIRCYG